MLIAFPVTTVIAQAASPSPAAASTSDADGKIAALTLSPKSP
jgi:hypothetical protein